MTFFAYYRYSLSLFLSVIILDALHCDLLSDGSINLVVREEHRVRVRQYESQDGERS